jgi:hypothetical protein
MGYTTDFSGEFTLSPALSEAQVAYLKKFNETRRVTRDAAKTELRPDPLRAAVGLPVGPQGAFFVGETGFMGQNRSGDVTDGNRAPEGQPGLWCQWTPSDDGLVLAWDGGEKFYSYVEWLEYLIEHFLTPWGIEITGEVEWEGEERGDHGKLICADGSVEVLRGRIVYE